ncbi:hypothetical protein HY312_04720 [Candidatus Saccharibacteria bacterium]|nr:hypothetical protein [Candidatus Saccharibacteria bacterium]
MSTTVNVTLTNSGGNSTLAFSGKPDFPLTGILVTYGEINTDRGFHGYPVLGQDGQGGTTALNGGHIFAAGDNPSNVIIASGGSLTYAGLCFS